MDAEGELIDGGLLAAQVEDPDLRVGDTSTETALGVRLVLTVTVATGYSRELNFFHLTVAATKKAD